MIAKLLGHSGTDNTQRYMRLADQPALDAAKLVGGLLWDVLISVPQSLPSQKSGLQV